MNSINETGLQNCAKGDFVAYDQTTNSYVRGAAAWKVDANDGSLSPAYSAYVIGVLTSTPDASGIGIITTDGTLTASDVNIDNTGAGDYYLKNNGQAVLGVPEGMLPVYCGTLTASGNFVLKPAAPEYRGHRHTNYELTGTWTAQTSGDMHYVYDAAGYDYTATNLLSAVPSTALTVVKNGELLEQSEYAVIDGELFLAQNPGNATIVICTINPLIATDSEVRAVAPVAGNSIVLVSKAYGTIYLDTDFPITTTDANNGTCITDISNSGISTGSVVNTINGGGGIDVTISGGTATVSSPIVANTLVDFQTVNASNVLIGNTADGALITFPQGLNSSVLCLARVPHRGSGTWTVTVFLWLIGQSAGYVGALSGNLKIQTASAAGDALVTTANTISFNNVTGASDNKVYQVLSGEITEVSPNSLITVEISATAPGADIKVLTAGIKLG